MLSTGNIHSPTSSMSVRLSRMGTPTLSAGGVLKCGQMGSLCRNFIALHGLVLNGKIAISGRREHFSANYSRRRTPAQWKNLSHLLKPSGRIPPHPDGTFHCPGEIAERRSHYSDYPSRDSSENFTVLFRTVCASSSGAVLRFRLCPVVSCLTGEPLDWSRSTAHTCFSAAGVYLSTQCISVCCIKFTTRRRDFSQHGGGYTSGAVL